MTTFVKRGPFVANAAPTYDNATWLNTLETALIDHQARLNQVVHLDDPTWGAVGDGVTDDGTAIANALAALPAGGGELVLGPKNYYNNSVHAAPAGTLVRGAGMGVTTITGKGFLARTGCTYRDMTFVKGATSINQAIQFEAAAAVTDVTIQNCGFQNYISGGIKVEAPTAASHSRAIIRDCYFSGSGFGIYAIRLDRSLITGNTFVSNTGGSVAFEGGQYNRITDNECDGGSVGIDFVFSNTSAGKLGIITGNIISGNTIRGTTVEAIGLDCRANAATMAAREMDTITSSTSTTITLTNAGWASAGSIYAGYYLVVTTGPAAGAVLPITAHSNAVFTVTMSVDIQPLLGTATVVIGAPIFGNTVIGNTIHATGGTSNIPTITLFGMCFGNTVIGNTIHGKGIDVASLNGLPASLTPYTGTSGISYTNGLRGPSMFNTVLGNVVHGRDTTVINLNSEIWLAYYNYAAGADFDSYGNIVAYNQVPKGRIKIDRHEDLSYGNSTSVADSRTAVYKEKLQAAAPTTGTWVVGDRVYNSAPATTEYVGWICTVAGTPGTWLGFGAIA